MGLTLDDVGKKDVCFPRLEEMDGDFFNGEYDGAGGKVLGNAGPRLPVFIIRKDADFGGLHNHFNIMLPPEFDHMLGNQGNPAFPAVLILPANSDYCFHNIINITKKKIIVNQ